MTRGPADRPVAPADPESAALNAVLRQAQERAAAPLPPGPVPERDRPSLASRVRASTPIRGATVQGRTRGAHAHALQRKGRRKHDESSAGKAAPDPRGRGSRVDVEV